MPSQTNYITKEHSVTNAPGNYGTAKDDHAPIGYVSSSGWRYRDLMRFSSSAPPSGAKIVSCILRVKTTGGSHTQQGGSPRIRIRRVLENFAASGGGTEQWRSDADPVGFSTGTGTTNEVSYAFDGDDNTVYDFDITGIYEMFCATSLFKRDGTPAGGDTNHGIEIRAGLLSGDENDTNDRCEFWSMRGSYVPRAIITWTVPVAAGTPTLNGPLGTLATQPTSYSATWPDSTGVERWYVEVGTTLDGHDLWQHDEPCFGGTQSVIYAGAAVPSGQTIYWRARGVNEVGTYGPWAQGTFVVQATPVVVMSTGAMAETYNLDALATWSGSEGKARLKASYSHPQGLSAAQWEVEVNGASAGFLAPSPVASGGTVTLDLTTGWARNTNYSVRVRAQGSGGLWSAWTAAQNVRINWAQGIYNFTHGSGATDFATKHATPSGGALTRVVYLYRNATGPGAWQSTIGAVAKGTAIDMLVRLSSYDAAQNPTLSLARIEWSAAGSGGVLDHWAATAAGVTLLNDANFRRFGVHSLKVTPAAAAGYLRNTRAVDVSGATKYTISGYVHSGGAVIGGAGLALALLDEAGAEISRAPAGSMGVLAGTESTVGKGADDWYRMYWTVTMPGSEGDSVRVRPALVHGITAPFWVDALQFEEGEVASGWKPGMAGAAVVLDVGGIAVDATAGGIFRLKGSTGGIRDVVELYQKGLRLGTDTELSSPSVGVLHVNGAPVGGGGAPSGAAGGVLGGTYPNPGFAVDMATQAELDALLAVLGTPVAWTPALTGTTNPVLASAVGLYILVGKLCYIDIALTFGAGSVGSGTYSVSLPFAAATGVRQMLNGMVRYGSTFGAYLEITSGASIGIPKVDATTAGNSLRTMTPTIPSAFGSGDAIYFNGHYRIA